MNLTDQFLDSLHELKRVEFSETVLVQAKRCLLDYLGATIAGARMLGKKGDELLKCFGGMRNSDCAVIGFQTKTDVQNAAFVNGLSAHIAELDDGVISGIIHPGSPIISALLPLAEREGVGGTDLLSGIVIGYEASVRIAETVQPSHKMRGYHATGTCGAIGAAIGIAAMCRFSKSETKKALSAAAVSAGGSLKVLEDCSELKPFNVARAAQAGLASAFLAKAGFEGPDDVFSGNTGFLSVMSDEQKLTNLTGTGDCLAVERVYVKPHAACRYCHPAIDAALRIRTDHSLVANEIKFVSVDTYKWAVKNHDHTNISGISSAKMSIPYSVAVALVKGKVGMSEFTDECMVDRDVSSVTERVSVSSCDELTKNFPDKTTAIVKVTTRDGDGYQERIDHPKGGPNQPLTDEELEEKFADLTSYAGKSEADSNEMIRVVWNIGEELDNLFQLL